MGRPDELQHAIQVVLRAAVVALVGPVRRLLRRRAHARAVRSEHGPREPLQKAPALLPVVRRSAPDIFARLGWRGDPRAASSGAGRRPRQGGTLHARLGRRGPGRLLQGALGRRSRSGVLRLEGLGHNRPGHSGDHLRRQRALGLAHPLKCIDGACLNGLGGRPTHRWPRHLRQRHQRPANMRLEEPDRLSRRQGRHLALPSC
mmetsp:Transcript_494/g.1324  ORF Transcript_494/g.1324 Transcript_494/m.1324 type:complete len:203 (-) Transcript_494:100-708(-)